MNEGRTVHSSCTNCCRHYLLSLVAAAIDSFVGTILKTVNLETIYVVVYTPNYKILKILSASSAAEF